MEGQGAVDGREVVSMKEVHIYRGCEHYIVEQQANKEMYCFSVIRMNIVSTMSHLKMGSHRSAGRCCHRRSFRRMYTGMSVAGTVAGLCSFAVADMSAVAPDTDKIGRAHV